MSAGLLLLVIAIHTWLVWIGPFPGDRWAARRAAVWATWPWVVREFGLLIQGIGTPAPALLIAGIGLALLLWKGRPGEAEGLVLVGWATAACALLKTIFGPTPVWVALNPASGANYPSGHVTFVTATIGYLGICAWRHGLRPVSALALLLVISVGPERVLSGAHAISDVIGAYFLSGAFQIMAAVCVSDGVLLLPRPRWRVRA